MSPLKNTDKHLSDYLPPALVKDWRQCFRSRSALLIFILLELAGWLVFFCMMANADKTPVEYLESLEDMGKILYAVGGFALCLAIPYRAGATVAADTKERSANFLMLTPLSARRIVWGTWSSTALLVLLAALCALPLLFARQLMLTAYPHVGQLNPAAFDWRALGLDVLALGWIVLCGWATTAFYMFAAGMSRVMRGLLVVVLFHVGGVFTMNDDLLRELFFVRGEKTPNLVLIFLCVSDGLLLILLFLELARRHYAAPAENCSRAVRLLAPLPLVSCAALLALLYVSPLRLNPFGQQVFALFYLYMALLADALMPTHTLHGQSARLWRWLPAWLQKPGLAPAATCLAFASLFFCLPEVVDMQNDVLCIESQAKTLLHAGLMSLNFGFSLMLWLLLTDCLTSRSSTKRPVVFGLVALACSFVAACLRVPLAGADLWVAAASLPLAGTQIPSASLCGGENELFLSFAINGGALLFLLLLLIFWRSRVSGRN